ncbi:metallophosphoesterase [Candidatus Pacearchaeota archaeon]|nr:metallophosphoesterase [Candidatus Pacearchaeota archaeon]
MPEYEFINKALFFPKQGILVIGDLHIGYEAMLRQSGVLVPARQIKDIIDDFKKIFSEIKKQGHELRKIVFIGDIKHMFTYEREEKKEFQEVIEFLGNYLPKENIILIKGNHDTMDYTYDSSMKEHHIEEDILFIHGHKKPKIISEGNVKTVVMGHIHPSVVFEDGVKVEMYKCFLTGISQNKNFIVIPSFLDFHEGTAVNDYDKDYVESFSPIPKKDIMKFKVYAVGENEVFEFGKVKDYN